MCRQTLRNEVPEAGKPALSCHLWLVCKRPVLARLSESALSFHIGFSAALGNLRWVRNISRTKPGASGGRFTSRHGSAAACRGAASDGFTALRAQHLHVGCARSRTRKRPKSARKIAKILAETERDERRRQRRGRPFKLTANKRNQAVQALWAMHVETLNWSGMTLTHYAAATKLSKSSLSRWRDLIDSGEAEIDWRAQLHPSARPQISTSSLLKNAKNGTFILSRVGCWDDVFESLRRFGGLGGGLVTLQPVWGCGSGYRRSD